VKPLFLLRPSQIPAFVIMGVLFYLSNQPGTGLPALHPPMDKIIHFLAYAVLGGSFCLWVREPRWTNSPIKHIAIVFTACAVFGISDEFHQSFVPGRSVSIGDFIADLAGCLLAIMLYWITRFYRFADRIRFCSRPPGLEIRESRPEK